jgi:hypothetical protein
MKNTQIDDIAAVRNLQMSRLFAQTSQASERRMERLAEEANHDASSVNIITIITLVFLPATFLSVW